MASLFSDFPGDDGIPGAQRVGALCAVILGTTMAVLDGAIVNIALPSIARSLHTGADAAIWVANAYLLVAAMSLVTFAALGDILGFRRIFIAGFGIFMLASLGCSLSRSLPMLIGMRLLQGLGGAAAMSVGPALYRSIFPTRLLGAGLGVNALVVASATAASPALGGLLLSVANWPVLFAINVPLGVFTLYFGARFLPRKKGRGGAFDVWGALLSAVAMGATVLAADSLSHLSDAGQRGAALLTSALFALVALGAGALFVYWQRRAKSPLLPLKIFASKRFSLATLTSICSFTAQGITLVSLPFLLQSAYGYSVLKSAVLFSPWPIAIVMAAPVAGRLADRVVPGKLSSAGLAVLTFGLAMLALLPTNPSEIDIVWRNAVCGLGFGFFQSPNNRELMGSAPRELSGAASGVLAVARTFGQCLGAAVVAIVLALGMRGHAVGPSGRFAPGAISVSFWIAAAAAFLATFISVNRIGRGGGAASGEGGRPAGG